MGGGGRHRRNGWGSAQTWGQGVGGRLKGGAGGRRGRGSGTGTGMKRKVEGRVQSAEGRCPHGRGSQ